MSPNLVGPRSRRGIKAPAAAWTWASMFHLVSLRPSGGRQGAFCHSTASVLWSSCSRFLSISLPKCSLLPQGFCTCCSLHLEDSVLRKLALNLLVSAVSLIDSSHGAHPCRALCQVVGIQSKHDRSLCGQGQVKNKVQTVGEGYSGRGRTVRRGL